jgi:hypothetical protein
LISAALCDGARAQHARLTSRHDACIDHTLRISNAITFQAVLSCCFLHGNIRRLPLCVFVTVWPGTGVPAADAAASLLLAQESAASNNANGAVRLGYLLQFGKGTPKDLSAATKYYRMAADIGHAEGLYRLAVATQMGDGVAEDARRQITNAVRACCCLCIATA